MKTGILIVLVLFTGFVSIIGNDRIQQVIDAADNPEVKRALIAFKERGVEKQVDTASYHIDSLIAYAQTFLGTPHKMGGTTKSGIDCSGLVLAAHKKFGIALPHSCHEQARYGAIVPKKEDLKRGDLVFFYNSYASRNFITHSGIYLGEGMFIHVSRNKGVVIVPLDDPSFWNERYLFGTRLKEPAGL